MRPGQHNNNNNNNKNRNRNRNRRQSGGSSSGSNNSSGNGANRVYDSNGPDVKLRGTAQTIAEKYMQLGRDALSSGDTVMAESYHQFADHYYRVWLSVQPVGQPIQFARRLGNDDEFEDESAEGNAEGDDDSQGGDPVAGEATGSEALPIGDDGERSVEASGDGHNQQRQQRPYRDNQNGGNSRNSENRDGQRPRQRWPRRNERFNADGNNGQATDQVGEQVEPSQAQAETRFENAPEPHVETAQRNDAAEWEAPSFLTRPTPIVAAVEAAEETAEPERPTRPRRVRVAVPAAEDGPKEA